MSAQLTTTANPSGASVLSARKVWRSTVLPLVRRLALPVTERERISDQTQYNQTRGTVVSRGE